MWRVCLRENHHPLPQRGEQIKGMERHRVPMWSHGPIDLVVFGARNITFDFCLATELINSHLKKNGIEFSYIFATYNLKRPGYALLMGKTVMF